MFYVTAWAEVPCAHAWPGVTFSWLLFGEGISAPNLCPYLRPVPSWIMCISLKSISGGSLSSWQPPSVSGASCPPRQLLGAGASPSTESWCPVLSRHRAASMPSPPFSSSHSALSQHVWLTSTVLLDYTETDNFLYQQFASGASLLLGDKHVWGTALEKESHFSFLLTKAWGFFCWNHSLLPLCPLPWALRCMCMRPGSNATNMKPPRSLYICVQKATGFPVWFAELIWCRVPLCVKILAFPSSHTKATFLKMANSGTLLFFSLNFHCKINSCTLFIFWKSNNIDFCTREINKEKRENPLAWQNATNILKIFSIFFLETTHIRISVAGVGLVKNARDLGKQPPTPPHPATNSALSLCLISWFLS